MRLWGIWLFLHLIGVALWLGGMFTLSLWTSKARASGSQEVIAFAYATARRLYRGLIAVAATVTITAGAVLIIATGRPFFRPFPEHWLFQMQVAGTLAFLATLFIVLPTAGRLAALAERAGELGEDKAQFAAKVKQQAIVGSLVGALLVYVVLTGALRI
ncbi:MAG: DUF2269 family protein [Gemmatimonadetes bacterium]|nr:DUF2269 family protein [Gemmatimonadota bacterium]NIO32110.1 DUF2269 family protein [Gemmatimonadota bacterium]